VTDYPCAKYGDFSFSRFGLSCGQTDRITHRHAVGVSNYRCVVLQAPEESSRACCRETRADISSQANHFRPRVAPINVWLQSSNCVGVQGVGVEILAQSVASIRRRLVCTCPGSLVRLRGRLRPVSLMRYESLWFISYSSDDSRGSIAFSNVCVSVILSVCLSVCPHDNSKTYDPKVFKRGVWIPWYLEISYNWYDLGSKGQRSRSQGHKVEKGDHWVADVSYALYRVLSL